MQVSSMEMIRINRSSITISVTVAIGKEGDFFVAISPALNVSGYGKTKEEAQESFDENVNVFCSDLLSLTKKNMEAQLQLLGFKQEKLNHKNYSKAYVDENGVLQNFEEGTLEETRHEATACA